MITGSQWREKVEDRLLLFNLILLLIYHLGKWLA